ncbi:DNA-directed RNA polymerase subunit K [Candidatus Woesearchaeota archaeon]|nr:MAG: DNA-directed RNA polymerase subunit K [Candidatus Woesearchaeota archaeon]
MVNYTKYEKARIIGARALQLAMGAPMLLKLKKAELEAINYSPVEIAKLEMEKGVLPITIRRPLPEKTKTEAS